MFAICINLAFIAANMSLETCSIYQRFILYWDSVAELANALFRPWGTTVQISVNIISSFVDFGIVIFKGHKLGEH